MACPKCAAPIEPEWVLCPNCSADLRAPAPAPAPAAAPSDNAPASPKCPQCGDPTETGWTVCPNCGTALGPA